MKCQTCGYDGPSQNDLWCGNPDCGDFIGDPEIEQEMQADAMLLDVLGGAFDDDPELGLKVIEELREYYAGR